MAKTGTVGKRTSFSSEAENAARDERAIQRGIDRIDAKAGKGGKKSKPMQAGARVYPVPPVPGQHLAKPGREAELDPASVFLAAPSCSSYITGEVLPIIGGYSGG